MSISDETEIKRSLSVIAYDEIKTMILSLALKPGSSVTEMWLIDRLRMSRTPIREALYRLQQEHFVELVPGKGWFVSEINLSDIQELYVIREALEGISARHAAEQISDEELQRMEIYLDSLETLLQEDEEAVDDPGDSIHNLIFRFCGNALINEVMSIYLERLQMFHLITSSLPGRKLQSWREHREIFYALKARDGALAEDVMRKHIRSSLESLLLSLIDNKIDYQKAIKQALPLPGRLIKNENQE
ncbi:GntR family transcriptional regulator [Phytobacter massiliensis]|uniref:GntR family transcriptional regulator n=1 Tax=Phytobacter massiliensis TaxID=1485952 RepID=UPI0002F738BB|nr:GntR family transcriptional regulator [Phytobacter massiliensis]